MAVHTLIIMRHGQSEFNDQNLFCGWVDVKLTEKGKEQAKKAGELILKSGLKPTKLYTSKLTRTCQTGNIILDTIDRLWIDVNRSWRLNERHYGALQGRNKRDVLQQVGKEKYMYWRRAYDGCPPDIDPHNKFAAIDNRYKFVLNEVPTAESLHMVVDRLKPYLEHEILNDLRKNEVVLVVAHGSTIRSILKIINKISDEDIRKVNIPNGVPLVVKVDDDLNLVEPEYYLDPETAKKRAELVAIEGFSKL